MSSEQAAFDVGTGYSCYNVWGDTSSGVGGYRRRDPVGTVIHSTNGTASLHWLQRGSEQAGSPASADCLIKPDGARYYISAPGRYAYHAGVSALTWGVYYENIVVNEMFLGVELEYLDTSAPTWQQLDSCAEYIVNRGMLYAWRWPYVVFAHSGIARPLGRRSDPVNFNWGAFMGYLYARARQAGVAGLE